MKDNDEIAVTVALLLVMHFIAFISPLLHYYSLQLTVLVVQSDGWEGLLLTYFSKHSHNNNQEAQTLRRDLLQEG